MSSRITRRDAAVRLVTQSALLWTIPLPLFGQTDQEDESREDARPRGDTSLREAINTAINQGESLRAEVVSGSVPTTPWINGVIRRELAHRRDLAQAFFSASSPDAKAYVHDGFMPAYEFVVTADVPPFPPQKELKGQVLPSNARILLMPMSPSGVSLLILFLKLLEYRSTLTYSESSWNKSRNLKCCSNPGSPQFPLRSGLRWPS